MRHNPKTCLVPECYHQALTDTLSELAHEDKEEHGRLIVMKEALISLMQEEQLEAKYTAMFYAKDFSCIRDINDSKLITDLKDKPPTTEEIQQVMEARKKDNPFSQEDLFLKTDGTKNVKEEAKIVKEALLKKDGLVDADKQDELRTQISNAFSDEMLDKLSEDIESRDTESP